MTTNPSESLEKCLELFDKDRTDEEKFAGLLLITKLVQPHEKDSMILFFNRLDFQFLLRLLRSGIFLLFFILIIIESNSILQLI